MGQKKLIISSAYAAIATIVFVAVITVWAELSVPLKDWLKNFSGHHWTSKSIFSVAIDLAATVIFYLTLPTPSEERLRGALFSLLVFSALGVVVITAFFTGHHLKFY